MTFSQQEKMYMEKLPWRQVLSLSAANFSQAVMLTAPFTIGVFMVRDFEASKHGGDEDQVDEQVVGRLTGVLAGIFSFSSFLTAYAWGCASNYIGRKPVIIIGNAVSFVSIVWFGLSGSYTTALVARSFGGLFNGILGAWKCMIGESTDVLLQGKFFGYMSLAWGLGCITGPALGGLFSRPCSRLPHLSLCGEGQLLRARPYFVACLMGSLTILASLLLSVLLLEETLPHSLRDKGLAAALRRRRRRRQEQRHQHDGAGGDGGKRRRRRRKAPAVADAAPPATAADHAAFAAEDADAFEEVPLETPVSPSAAAPPSSRSGWAHERARLLWGLMRSEQPHPQPGRRAGPPHLAADLSFTSGRSVSVFSDDTDWTTDGEELRHGLHSPGPGLPTPASPGGGGGKPPRSSSLVRMHALLRLASRTYIGANPFSTPSRSASCRRPGGVRGGVDPGDTRGDPWVGSDPGRGGGGGGGEGRGRQGADGGDVEDPWFGETGGGAEAGGEETAALIGGKARVDRSDHAGWAAGSTDTQPPGLETQPPESPLQSPLDTFLPARAPARLTPPPAPGPSQLSAPGSSAGDPNTLASGRGTSRLGPAALAVAAELDAGSGGGAAAAGGRDGGRGAQAPNEPSDCTSGSGSDGGSASGMGAGGEGGRDRGSGSNPATTTACASASASTGSLLDRAAAGEGEGLEGGGGAAAVRCQPGMRGEGGDGVSERTGLLVPHPGGPLLGSCEVGDPRSPGARGLAAPGEDEDQLLQRHPGGGRSGAGGAERHGGGAGGALEVQARGDKGRAEDGHRGGLDAAEGGGGDDPSPGGQQQVSERLLPWYRYPQVVLTILGYGATALIFCAVDEVFPIFAAASRASGGLGMREEQIAPPLMFFGLVLMPYSLYGYPALQRRVGTLRLTRAGLAASVATCLLIPLVSDLREASAAVAMVVLYLGMVIKAFAQCSAFTGSIIAVNAAPSQEQLGAVNGVGQTLAALVRGVGPALGGVMWAVSLGLHAPGQQFLTFGMIAAVAAANFFLYGFVQLPNLK